MMEREIRRVCRRPIRSARPPHTKAPTIIPRYTIRPERRRERETKPWKKEGRVGVSVRGERKRVMAGEWDGKR